MTQPNTDALQLRFRSAQFAVQLGEDEATNPERYGRALAGWISAQLIARGWPADEADGDDWGWRVDVPQPDFGLCVGCVNESLTSRPPEGQVPAPLTLTWCCAVIVDLPLRWRFWQPGPHAMPAAQALFDDVLAIVRSLPDVHDLEIG